MSGREVRVVAAVIRDGHRVLAARRASHLARGGLWEFPGGKVEPGEDDAEALAREIREELGASVDVGGWLGEAVHAYEDLTIVLAAYGCGGLTATPESTDHDEIRWLTVEQFAEVSWAPADVPLLEPVRTWLGSGEVVERP